MINEHVKSEFKRFFDYAFKFNIGYWQDFSGWKSFWGKIRTPDEDKLFNRLVNDVIRSEEGLKKIINDPQLASAKELKYYAYIFLKDLGKTEGIAEPALSIPPEQYAGIYDNPSKLINIIRDSSKPSDVRLWALNRVKELSPWNSYPTTLFDREIFNRKKWDNWMGRSSSIDGRGSYKSIDKNFYNAKMLEHAKSGRENAFSLYVEGYILATGEAPKIALPDKPTEPVRPPFPSGMKTGHPAAFNIPWYRDAITNYNNEKATYPSRILEYNNIKKCIELIPKEWSKYRKEQDEEFPPILSQYEQALAVDVFSDAKLTTTDYTNNDYLILQNRLGEAKAKELWNSPEKLLQVVEGEFDGELKNIVAERLYDMTVLTFAEQKRVLAGLRDVYVDMFFGDSFTVLPVNPEFAEVVSNEELSKEEQKTKDSKKEL